MGETGVNAQLIEIDEAERRLRTTFETFERDDLSAPSLCGGWTRGHVLAHIALNAHSLVNLFTWARTGRETPQYPSSEVRAADIERHSTRTLDEHREALDEASDAFTEAARAVPHDRWNFPVSGIGGSPVPAATYLFGRLREIEVHHVDLDTGYGPDDWSEAFVRRALEGVPERFDDRVEAAFTIEATDLGLTLTVGHGEPVDRVRGPGAALIFWFLGRGEGTGLLADRGPLPSLPGWG